MAHPHHRRRRAVEVVVAALAGVALAVAIDVARTGGVDTWLAIRGLGPPYDAQGQHVDVGGHRLYLDCRGSGTPTVILENGLGVGAGGWGFVLPRLTERTRVCAYDRAGIGRSEPRGPHTVGEAVADLRTALTVAGERGPWLIVGHSLGGVYGRVFADRFRTETVGLVLVDAYFPDGTWMEGLGVDPTYTAESDAGIAATARWIEDAERLRWPESLAELHTTSLAGLPVEVLAVDQHLRYQDERIPADQEERIIEAWRRWCLALAPGTTRITIAERSGHVIQLDRPDVVIAAVDRVLEATRR